MFKIIMLDYSMPDMDGPEVANKICKLFPERGEDQEEPEGNFVQRPYICCCTAFTETHHRQSALSSGMDYFLSKPVSPEELEDLLKLLD